MSEQGINRLAISQLRPGNTLDDVRRAWGSRWTPLARKDEGYVWGREAGVDCCVRIDVNDVVGSVSVYGQFPAKYQLEGVSLGMGLADVQLARPELAPTSEPDEGARELGIVEYRALLANGWQMDLRLRKDAVIGIDIARPDSIYPSAKAWVAAPPGKYPPPDATPGLPFADPNLKLAVLHELQQRGVIDLGEPADLAMHLRQRFVDLEQEGYEFMPDCYDYLVRYPLDAQQLQAVQTLCFDGGLEIYRYMFYHWDGESDEFDITSLAGLEQCVNLAGLDIIAMCGALDLAPLATLAKLRDLGLAFGPYASEQLLRELPALRKFSCFSRTLKDPGIVAALRARGVSVRLYE